MKPSSLYGHILEILGLVDGSRRPADEIVGEFFRSRRYLGARDRRFIGDAVFDIVRNRILLRRVADLAVSPLPGFSPGPRARPFLDLAGCLVVLRREEKASILAGLTALWETFVPGPSLEIYLDSLITAWTAFPWPESPVERLSVSYSLHPFVVSDWVDRYGGPGAEELCRVSNASPPTVARVNTLRCTREECLSRLAREGVGVTPTTLSPDGLRFDRRLNIQGLLSYRDGWFEMQDEGSQLISYLVAPKPGERVLDACAGGGGKTLHLAALMKNSGHLVASDVSKERLTNLKERSRRAGVAIVRIASADPAPHGIEGEEFDAVLIDAPCSGTGTYRRNPWLKEAFDPEGCERLATTQQSLLARYAASVRPGGRLVYATCSLLWKENQGQVAAFLKAHPDFTVVPANEILEALGIHARYDDRYLELLPSDHGTDGYFAVVLKRNASGGDSHPGTV